jgi:hypothetical protein
MSLTLAPRKYTSNDAERFELISGATAKLLKKNNLTLQDVLTGLRYNVSSKETWEEATTGAIEACVAYDRYHDVDAEETIERYGEDI